LFGKKYGEDGSVGSGDGGSATASKEGTNSEEEDHAKALRIAAAAAGGPGEGIDYGGGPAAPKKAKKSSNDMAGPATNPVQVFAT
jgi:hypothetical protein